MYGLPVWGPSLSVNLLHRITRLHNCGICMTSGLHKYDHVSHSRFVIGWLPVSSVIQHCSLVAMYKQYKCNHCLLLSPQIEFGRQSSYHTRTPASFVNISRYNLSFNKRFFRSRATNWWNDLPITLISGSVSKLSRELAI